MFGYEQESIKNCPFCGGKAHLYNNAFHVIIHTYAYVKCSRCGTRTKQYKGINWEDTNWLAIEAWNRRVNNN